MIISEVSDMVERCLSKYIGKPMDEMHVIELGDIVIKNCMGVKGKQYSKDWFNASNVASHISIDINGRGGALSLDLGKRMPEFDNTADLILNGGTAEHVEDIYECFLNMYQWGKVGSIMITWGPPINTAPKHSPWAYALHIPMALCTFSGYAMVEQDIRVPNQGRNPNPKDNLLLAFILKKMDDSPFIDRETWERSKVAERR